MKRRRKPGSHRKRRPRPALPGMMLHIDGSDHVWFQDERRHELIVILDDATSEIYYARSVEAESTRTVMLALWEVIETKGLFCSLYSDRAGHFFVTPKRDARVDPGRPTQGTNARSTRTTRFQSKTECFNWNGRAGATPSGQTVVVHEHLDGRISIRYGPHVIAQYASDKLPPQAPKRRRTPRLPSARKGA